MTLALDHVGCHAPRSQAVKNDPLNFSARYFLNSAFALTRQRTSAEISKLLLYRLLSPANQNSFSRLDYTPMFEPPYMGLITMGFDPA